MAAKPILAIIVQTLDGRLLGDDFPRRAQRHHGPLRQHDDAVAEARRQGEVVNGDQGATPFPDDGPHQHEHLQLVRHGEFRTCVLDGPMFASPV